MLPSHQDLIHVVGGPSPDDPEVRLTTAREQAVTAALAAHAVQPPAGRELAFVAAHLVALLEGRGGPAAVAHDLGALVAGPGGAAPPALTAAVLDAFAAASTT